MNNPRTEAERHEGPNMFVVDAPSDAPATAPAFGVGEPPPPAAQVPKFRTPVATLVILAVLIACFACEMLLGVQPAEGVLKPHVQTLLALGGDFRPAVLEDGEWYRLITSAFLHGDIVHLLMNGAALWMVGVILETIIGWRWFFFVYVVGAFGGSLMSLAINGNDIVSVGASGAIMALFAAAMVTSLLMPEGSGRTALQGELARVLLPSLLPIMTVRGAKVDIASHIGGAITGVLIGVALYRWMRDKNDDERILARRSPVPNVAWLGVAFAIFGFISLRNGYAEAKAASASVELLPNDELPLDDAAWSAGLDEWLREFPSDPRVLTRAATRAKENGNTTEADLYYRRAIEQAPRFERFFAGEHWRLGFHAQYAEFLSGERRDAEAEQFAAPICALAATSEVRREIYQYGFCDQVQQPIYRRDIDVHRPDNLPANDQLARCRELLETFPNAPGLWICMADNGDAAEREHFLQLGVDRAPAYARYYPDRSLEFWFRQNLAAILSDRRSTSELRARLRATMEPVCQSPANANDHALLVQYCHALGLAEPRLVDSHSDSDGNSP